MNKEQQIVEFQNDIIDNLFDGGTYKLAEALYNAGYRKTFTSDFASDTQKAYKDGYEKGIKDEEEKRNRLLDALYGSWDENSRLKNEIIKKDEILQKNIDTAIDIHKRHIKEMNAMCNIDEQRKQAVKEFADKLKKKVHNYYPSIDSYCTSKHVILVKDIDELLKEYEK